MWAGFFLALPVFGVFLYAFVGQSKVPKKMNRKFSEINERFDKYRANDDEILSELSRNNDDIKSQCHYLSGYSGYGAHKNTDVTYFSQTDQAYKAMLEELSKAEKYIFMEYFAMEDAISFKKIEDILYTIDMIYKPDTIFISSRKNLVSNEIDLIISSVGNCYEIITHEGYYSVSDLEKMYQAVYKILN